MNRNSFYNLYILRRKPDDGFCLEQAGISMKPGYSLSDSGLEDLGSVRLVSGFPGLMEDQPVTISPALQLNGDLSRFTPAQLCDLAERELFWKNQVIFRSYTLEPDFRAAVIAGSPERLSSFMDTWGGILEITPILTGGYHPGATTASDIKIRQEASGVTLSISARSPFDSAACSGCGVCAPECPEGCLKKEFFIDFDSCTMCGLCAEACPTKAIDLHAFDSVEVTVPAVIFLSDSGLSIPGHIRGLFPEDQLDSFVSSICERLVEEVISVDPFICQLGSRPGAGCRKCLEACPSFAVLVRDGSIEIDHLACTECGRCVGSCPTGALQYERFNDRALSAYTAGMDLAPGTTVVIGSEDALHEFWWKNRTKHFPSTLFMEYPQIGALGTWHLLLLLAQGAGRVLILDAGETGADLLSSAISLVNRIVRILFGTEGPFAAYVSVGEAASWIRGTEDSLLSGLMPQGRYAGRRRDLVRILAFLIEHASGTGSLEAGLSADFGSLTVDTQLCTQCLACLNECKIQALRADQDRFSLSIREALCVQCGLCAAVCPEEALSLLPGLRLEGDFLERKVLVEAEPARCRACGRVFGTRKSLDRVKEILSEREDLDLELFEYCEDCRVKRFFEKGGKQG